MSKTCFESRPVYVRTNDRIDAHFATCFLALVLMRLLEQRISHKYPAGQILESIKKYNCTHLDKNNWQFTYFDEIIETIGKIFGMELNKKYRTQRKGRSRCR